MEGTLDLAGPWLVRADPENVGVARQWHMEAAWTGENRTITLPNPMQKELGADHRGVAWVARKVELPHSWQRMTNERLWIRFESVATDATVWVNGVRVGQHTGDFIPFQFEITDGTAAGKVWIAVRIDQLHAPRPGPGVLTENGHLTKGFHDVLSLQHSGVWCGVNLRRSGPATILPNGLSVATDADKGTVSIAAELDGSTREQHVALSILGPDGSICGAASEMLPDGTTSWNRTIQLNKRGDLLLFDGVDEQPARLNLSMGAPDTRTRQELEETVQIDTWSPDRPRLYHLILDLVSGRRPSEVVETHQLHFAFRTVSTAGSDNRHILLNGKPLFIRGILHWGHEPDHIAPAPSPAQVRAEFVRLKQLGFNCVCLCMWYPPEYYCDIADEMGMLIWQEHPVWKSPMQEEHIPEYQRLYKQLFRRDRRHPSVIIVSGSCEHERFNPRLSEWWWKTAKEMTPGALKQLQTGFIGWTDPEKTDLYDEHVYDSSGRWVRFVEDVKTATAALPRKPFIMGETIIGTAWVDTSQREDEGSWWHSTGVAECRAFEKKVKAEYGQPALERFLAAAHGQNVAIRKFQVESLRCFDGCAGLVMNQIRDVPVARLGFMDDFGRWRISAEETRPWLSDRVLLLRTPGQQRSFQTDQAVNAEIGISNFSDAPFQRELEVHLESAALNSNPQLRRISFHCEVGEVRLAPLTLEAATSEWPVQTSIHASGADTGSNSWRIWRFPSPPPLAAGIARLDGSPFTAAESDPDFEERGYSSGWGLKIRSWSPLLQTANQLIPAAQAWQPGTPIPPNTTLIASHRITPDLLDFVSQGGRLLLLANKTTSGLAAKFINVWGQCPLVVEQGPLTAGDADWITDLLHIDLFDRHPRAIAVDDLGITDQVQPLIRLVFTHDRGTPKMFDAVFSTRVGSGMLIATSLDHSGAAGRFLLHQLLNWGATTQLSVSATLDPVWIRKHVFK